MKLGELRDMGQNTPDATTAFEHLARVGRMVCWVQGVLISRQRPSLRCMTSGYKQPF